MCRFITKVKGTLESLFDFRDQNVKNATHIIKRTVVGDILVSTIFLYGIDYGSSEGPSLFYETMVFQNGEEIFQRRYTTLQDAITGHTETVGMIRIKP